MAASATEARFEALSKEANQLPYEDPKHLASDSAWDNCTDSEREGVVRFSEEWFEIWNSTYGCALEMNS